MSVQIINLPLVADRQKEMVEYLCEKFEASVKARINQVDSKYRRWLQNYAGEPLEKVRTTPFLKASNFMPQLIRMHTDILVARMYGLLMAAKPFWNPKVFNDDFPWEVLGDMRNFMEFVSRFPCRLPEVLDSALRRVCKTGTVTLKGPMVTDDYYHASGLASSGQGISTERVTQEYLQLQCLPYEDVWFWPITANDETEADVIFHRLRLTKEQVERRGASGLWSADAVKKLLEVGKEVRQEPARQAVADEAGLILTNDVDRPFTAIEASFRYPVQVDQMFKCVVTFNPKCRDKDGYLRGHFSPYRTLENTYVNLCFMPREDFIYGYSIPEVLEQYQEEQAQIHNARRDASVIANVPGWKKKRDSTVPNPSSEWYPGKVFELENIDDLQPLTFGGQYNSMIDEESFLLQLAERTTGISPPMQGAGAGGLSGKRGNYASMGTLALLAEGNRRIDIYLKRLQYPMHRVGNLIYQSYRTFKPNGAEYSMWGQNGQAIQKSYQFKEPADYRGYFFEMSASDSSANKETDRTALLLMANTMAGYYRQIVEAATAVAQQPPGSPISAVLLLVLDGAKDLADRLLFSFDIGDRKKLLPDMRSVLGGSPQAGAEQANALGMPSSEEPVSVGDIQGLSQRLSAINGGGTAGPGNGAGR
jgi:hypothetical protein